MFRLKTLIVKAAFIRELALPFASRLKLPSIFIVSRKKKRKKKSEWGFVGCILW